MVEILNFIRDRMEEIDVPYEYGEWTDTVTYPYFVGGYDETGYTFEDDHTEGTITINGWSRDSKITLLAAADTIKEAFEDVQSVVDDRLFHIRFGGVQAIPSGEQGLFRVMITLYASEWKGE